MAAERRARAPGSREDGDAPIRDYAAIGDGRTVALVARDGAIDWLCLPDLDSPSVFARLLDAGRGGAFTLAPEAPFEVERRYRPGTNVLETTFHTAGGAVRVTDAMTLPHGALPPLREVVRRVEGLAGRVPMRWRVEPRFGYGEWPARLRRQDGACIASARGDAVALQAWDAGEPGLDGSAFAGRFEARAGATAHLSLTSAHAEPLVFSARAAVDARLDATAAFWARWTAERRYEGPWRDAVIRSALALKLLVHAPSGAIAAAATTSLPEQMGGERNWDYRFSWIRDSAFTLESLLQLGCVTETHAFFWWFMHATRLTHPRLRVLYRLDGGAYAPERTRPLAGYRGSTPVRTGNAAADQEQLDLYGDLFDAAWVYTQRGGAIGRDTGRDLADIADYVCRIWRSKDRGMWEVRSEGADFTQSKAMCWIALDRALKLADQGYLPRDRCARWRTEANAIRTFIETRCWSERRQSYVRCAGSDELDASLLLLGLARYREPDDPRIVGTVEAVRRELARGPLVYRYTGEDGLKGQEGVFLCCSFWLVEALALTGRRDEAARAMEALVGLANDVGLYAEELDPSTNEFLGNFPQGLVHLALISAAMVLAPSQERR